MAADVKRVLVIDDDAGMRHMLRLVLEKEGYQVAEAASADLGLSELDRIDYAVVLCDIRMPGMDGHQFLRALQGRGHAATVIMMSAYGSIDTALACMKEGAYDYISKPFKPDEVVLTLRKAAERQRLQAENIRLRSELSRQQGRHQLISRSDCMDRVVELVRRAAATTSTVLVTGETGTGKEVVARTLHQQSARAQGPFIAVNCSAIPAALLESELFGYVRGAYTGADRSRIGLVEAAAGGTLFLDEVGELPLELQPKLLRVVQEKEVRRVGENLPRQLDLRVVTATSRDLPAEIRQGHFRQDLYFRLAVIEIRLPPLRDRPEDIGLLAEHFLQRIAAREGCLPPQLAPSAVSALSAYGWPGNVRELENVVEQTLFFVGFKPLIERSDLSLEALAAEPQANPFSLKAAAARLERQFIRRALAATDGNRTRAARFLEISLRNLLYKIKEYGLNDGER